MASPVFPPMFSELLDGMTITVKSPDGNIEWEIQDGRNVAVEIAPGRYRRYTESALEGQLAALLRAMSEAERQARRAALSEAVGYEVGGGGSPDRATREYLEEVAVLRAEGASKTGRIQLSRTGSTRWEVRLRPGTLQGLSEDEFLHDLWSAFTALMTDRRRRLALLKRDILEIPSGKAY